ncbi:MAG TPA: nucleotide exchange factor GrpE [Candidatus Dormibacteraeota bacterium]|nr:nucleotide exchange factor GrpE [Candidatus Dormibacteraeota bacterium]
MPAKHEKPVPTEQSERDPSAVLDNRSNSAGDFQPHPPGGAETQSRDAELQALRQELQETFARYQRLAADFENYKRRTRQELADRTQYANEELVRKLLPILDNFRRALEHAPENGDPKWFEGIKLVARQFEETLQAQGVSQIPAVGEKFDPTQHEAIAREETDEHEEGTVVEEVQPGYRLHNRVLRPTLVKVAQPRALKS